MRVLVVGSGGREHALCWAIAASPLLTKLWCAPARGAISAAATGTNHREANRMRHPPVCRFAGVYGASPTAAHFASVPR